jgi:hypothetical protein
MDTSSRDGPHKPATTSRTECFVRNSDNADTTSWRLWLGKRRLCPVTGNPVTGNPVTGNPVTGKRAKGDRLKGDTVQRNLLVSKGSWIE